MNELTKPSIGIDNGQIHFKNVDEFKTDFEQVIQRNSHFIVTEETLKGSANARAELRNAAKESASWRSKVKTELLKPFDDVSEIAIAYEKQVKAAADDIDKDIKVFEEVERQKRRDGLTKWIAERAAELDVNPDITINEKWFIKGNFNGTVPKQAFVDDHIEPELERLVQAKAQRAADTIAIRNYAESKSFDPEGYIHSLDFKSLAEIMGDIDGDVIKREKREEAAAAVAEMEANQAREQHVDEVTVANKIIDKSTGEIVSETQQEPVDFNQPVIQPTATQETISPENQIFTRLLYVTGTIKDMQSVATFLNANGIAFRGES
ncbi:DUF1351 domain-containing protein [Leuconostoc miyukkimchii]|uniref:DUF1351 domain-containing protein n=1 Tax=Leuconostoc miyukkimchii TaxID=910540 RepID=UPI001C7CD85C|nr:DUF1351 domain-containing protein [Leuconostoc miyukkimchii]